MDRNLQEYNAFVGGTCVAFGFLCLFEVIDTVGPQWRWWVWNTEIATAKPSLGVVPYPSLEGFSLIVPFAVAFISRLLARRAQSRRLAHRSRCDHCELGGLAPDGPQQLLSIVLGSGTSQHTGQFIASWWLIVGAALITAFAFVGAFRARQRDPSIVPEGVERDYFTTTCVLVYLVFGAIVWAAALPAYLAAHNGVTPAGDPTGSLTFAFIPTSSQSHSSGAPIRVVGMPSRLRPALSHRPHLSPDARSTRPKTRSADPSTRSGRLGRITDDA